RRLHSAPVRPTMRPRHAAGLYGAKARRSGRVGRRTAVALEAGIERQVAPVVGMIVAAVAVGLPDLEQAIRHDGIVGVMQGERKLDALAGHARRCEVGAVGLDDGAEIERADRLRGRQFLAHLNVPLAWRRGRAARCRTDRRAPIRAACWPCRTTPAAARARQLAPNCRSGRTPAADRWGNTSA